MKLKTKRVTWDWAKEGTRSECASFNADCLRRNLPFRVKVVDEANGVYDVVMPSAFLPLVTNTFKLWFYTKALRKYKE